MESFFPPSSKPLNTLIHTFVKMALSASLRNEYTLKRFQLVHTALTNTELAHNRSPIKCFRDN